MARQRSEEKKTALLQAATEVFAAGGLGAPTAHVAKRAGVAEGTLFGYFPTKDDLLNELFAYLANNLGDALKRDLDSAASLHKRTYTIWNNYIDWGIDHPNAHNTLSRLAVSERVRPEVHAAAMALCLDVRFVTETRGFDGISAKASADFSDAVLSAIANATIACAAANPNDAEAYKAAGFGVVWKGLMAD